jgi:hypothetical protein
MNETACLASGLMLVAALLLASKKNLVAMITIKSNLKGVDFFIPKILSFQAGYMCEVDCF